MNQRTMFYQYVYIFFLCIGSFSSMAQENNVESIVPDKPNILFILTDDQGYHDVSYYGTTDIRTPNIDKIASSGLRFDNFYANSTVCSPTRAAILTGRYQDRVGVPGVIRTHKENNWGYLAPKATLLPQELNEAGYTTS
ncbi:MAG: sulfatase-like hydrolase/transferase, partial [Maribacter sp.]|nr:sulfatase-like hydrolase/transferase [Maribacter sp.]